MPLILPFVPSISPYRVGTVIDEFTVFFDVQFNDRAGRWYFSMSDQNDVVIVRGVKVMLGVYLAKAANHPLMRSGVLIARDLSGRGREAGFDDLGTRVQVYRFNQAEMASEISAS